MLLPFDGSETRREPTNPDTQGTSVNEDGVVAPTGSDREEAGEGMKMVDVC